ncbi:LexA family protein [Streptomyces xantholiticus]
MTGHRARRPRVHFARYAGPLLAFSAVTSGRRRRPRSRSTGTGPTGRPLPLARQAAIVTFIEGTVARQGYPPSMREIGLGKTSTGPLRDSFHAPNTVPVPPSRPRAPTACPSQPLRRPRGDAAQDARSARATRI